MMQIHTVEHCNYLLPNCLLERLPIKWLKFISRPFTLRILLFREMRLRHCTRRYGRLLLLNISAIRGKLLFVRLFLEL